MAPRIELNTVILAFILAVNLGPLIAPSPLCVCPSTSAFTSLRPPFQFEAFFGCHHSGRRAHELISPMTGTRIGHTNDGHTNRSHQ